MNYNATKATAAKPAEEPAKAATVEVKPVEANPVVVPENESTVDRVTATLETMQRRIAELEAFAVKIKQRLHLADQEVMRPQVRNHNPDYLPHHEGGVISYHDRPKTE